MPASTMASRQSSSLPKTPAKRSPIPARIAPVRVARSMSCVAPWPRAYHSASARIRRPSASGFVTSTVNPAAVSMTSDGRIASGPTMFSHAARTPITLTGRSSSAIAPSGAGVPPERGGPRRAAGHVALLAHDFELLLEEVAARVERHGLADEREPRAVGGVRGLVSHDDEPRRRGARAADGGERGEAGSGRVDDLDAQAGHRGRALRQARRSDDVRRRVDELAGDVRPARDDLGAVRGPGDVVARLADDEALDRGRGRRALPAARVVAAEHGALDDGLQLALLGH